MKVYDVFPFLNEIDLLELRMKILAPVVDYFVVCEAKYTYSGQRKPFNFKRSTRSRKVRHLKCKEKPVKGDAWATEDLQKKWFTDRLRNTIRRDDVVLCCDCDEIPNPKTVKDLLPGIRYLDQVRFDMHQYLYYLNGLAPWMHWSQGVMVTGKEFLSRGWGGCHRNLHFRTVGGRGWHFCSTGWPERTLYKARSTSHFDEAPTKEFIKKVEAGCSPDEVDPNPIEWLGSDDGRLPTEVRKHFDDYQKKGLIYTPNEIHFNPGDDFIGPRVGQRDRQVRS